MKREIDRKAIVPVGGGDSVVIKPNDRRKWLIGTEQYAVCCFRGGERRLTHTLTRAEARIFQKAALHLAKFLTTAYGLGKRTKEKP